MGKQLVLAPHLSQAELQDRFQHCEQTTERTRWHALWLVGEGYDGHAAAAVLACAPSTVSKTVNAYNTGGPAAVRDRRQDLPGRKPFLSRLSAAQLAELKALLTAGEAPAAVGGGLWTGPKVARWLEQALSLAPGSLDDKQGWRTLKQLGYSLKRPRPKHPETSDEDREAWKKGGSRTS